MKSLETPDELYKKLKAMGINMKYKYNISLGCYESIEIKTEDMKTSNKLIDVISEYVKSEVANSTFEIGKVYKREGEEVMLSWDSFVFVHSPYEEGLQNAYKMDTDGDFYACTKEGSTGGIWEEVTDKDELSKLSNQLVGELDIKNGDYVTIISEKLTKRDGRIVMKLESINSSSHNAFPKFVGKSVHEGGEHYDDALYYPLVFRKATDEEIEMYHSKFPEDKCVTLSSGLTVVAGDVLLHEDTLELIEITDILSEGNLKLDEYNLTTRSFTQTSILQRSCQYLCKMRHLTDVEKSLYQGLKKENFKCLKI